MNCSEYEEIKRNLETYLNDFNNNEVNNLDKKTKDKGMINDLPSNIHNALNSILSQTYPTSAD